MRAGVAAADHGAGVGPELRALDEHVMSVGHKADGEARPQIVGQRDLNEFLKWILVFHARDFTDESSPISCVFSTEDFRYLHLREIDGSRQHSRDPCGALPERFE